VLRHVVLFRWKPGTTPDDVEAVRRGLDRLPGLIPELRSYCHGPDLRLGEDTWDYGVVAEFEDGAGWEAYDRHPDHHKVRTELIRPHTAERATVRFDG
jgi:hypothetical protein